MASPTEATAGEGQVGDRVVLGVDRRGWGLWSTVTTICFVVTIAAIGIGTALADGPSTGGATALVFLVLLSPVLGVAGFASWAARSEAWIDVSSGGVTIHHPVFLADDVLINRNSIHSFFVGDLSSEPPQDELEDVPNSAWGRLRAQGRMIDERIGWHPPVKPSRAAPDLVTVARGRGWNFVLILQESFFLAGVPRRALGRMNLISRGMLCPLAPRRKYWIRGFFGVVEEPEVATAALIRAGFGRTELTPDVLAWLADEPPVPIDRAWKNYWRDKKRRRPGTLES